MRIYIFPCHALCPLLSLSRFSRDLNLLSEILLKSFMLDWASSFGVSVCSLLVLVEVRGSTSNSSIDKHDFLAEKSRKMSLNQGTDKKRQGKPESR